MLHFLLKCFDRFCNPVCSMHSAFPEALSPSAMILHIVLNPIALSMKYDYISKLLGSASTMNATSASVLDNVMRCAFDIHSTDAVYHE
jgi:hypothetical protein